MHIIVGLGNPGKKYEKTRHNAGFMFVEKMSEYLGWDTYYDVGNWSSGEDDPFLEREARAEGAIMIVFVKPMTFMNQSGTAVRQVLERRQVRSTQGLILVHDDLDIELGKYKVQIAVAPKDHRGVRSVEQAISKTDFLRVRIGVDSRNGDRTVAPDEYVLQVLTEEEYAHLQETMEDAVKHLRSVAQL